MEASKGCWAPRDGAEVGVAAAVVAIGLGCMAGWVLLTGCVSPPTKLEQKVFTITTNREPVVEVITNVLAVSESGETNEVTFTSGNGADPASGTTLVTNIRFRTN